MKKIFLGLFALSTMCMGNPLCLSGDIMKITKIVSEVNKTQGDTDKKVIAEGLKKVIHTQTKHNDKLNDKQKKILKNAETVLNKYNKSKKS